MLGMKSAVAADIDRAWLLLCDMDKARENADLPITPHARQLVRESTFSDTAVFITQDAGIDAVRALVGRSLEFFRAAWVAGIPVRGGIASGGMIVAEEPGVFVGDALVGAYYMGESQQMLGVSLDHESAMHFLSQPFEFTSGAAVVVPWRTPVRSGLESRYALNWPEFFRGIWRSIPTSAAALHGQVSLGVRFDCLDASVKCKYENTMRFLEHQLRLDDQPKSERAK